MFFMINTIDIANYADDNILCDDNTSYRVGKNQCHPEMTLQMASIKLFKGFYRSGTKLVKINAIFCRA